MKRFLKLFFASAIPFAVVMFAIALSNNSWQRALALAVIFAFLFGSGIAQIITMLEQRRNDKQNKKKS